LSWIVWFLLCCYIVVQKCRFQSGSCYGTGVEQLCRADKSLQCSGTIPTIPAPTIPESTMFFGLWSRFKAPSPSAKSNARSIHFWRCLRVSSLNSISVRARETSHVHFSTMQMLRARWHGFREIVGQIPHSNFDGYHQDPTFSKENILVRQCRRNRRTQSTYYVFSLYVEACRHMRTNSGFNSAPPRGTGLRMGPHLRTRRNPRPPQPSIPPAQLHWPVTWWSTRQISGEMTFEQNYPINAWIW